MATIRLTPEELNQQGQDIQGLADELISLLAQVDSKINAAWDGWDGLAQDAFLNSYSSMKSTLDQFPELVRAFGQQACGAAEAFGTADSELASSFNQ